MLKLKSQLDDSSAQRLLMDKDAEIRETACLPWDRRRLVSRSRSDSPQSFRLGQMRVEREADTAFGLSE